MAPKTRPVSVSLPLTIKGDRARVSGGYNNNFILAEVRTRVVRKEKKTFLKVSNEEPWLLAGVCGYRTIRQTGGLARRTSFVATMRRALEDACDIQQITAAGSNEATQEGDSNEQSLSDDEDLFTAGIGKQSPAIRQRLYAMRGNGKVRIRYNKNNCKGKVLHIEMPAIAPETDPTCTDKRMVSLLCESRKTLWLAEDDVEWAMKYIQDQLECNGCLGVADKGPGQGRPHPRP